MISSSAVSSKFFFSLVIQFLFILLGMSSFPLRAQFSKNNSPIFSDRIVVKLKQDGSTLFKREVEHFPEEFRFEPFSARRSTHLNKRSFDLDNVYLFAKIPVNASAQDVLHQLAGMSIVEYVEPLYKHRLHETPNDPLLTSQSYFDLIKAMEAWDIVKGGNGGVVIGLIDGGTDIAHPDLNANLWVNTNETPQNGVDDDQNGFIDDIYGWNFANDTANPTGLNHTTVSANHGTITAGIACAVTDNGIGIAGTSWNAKLMAVNAAHGEEDGVVEYGYEGILYAIENGADVINISWGRVGAPSFFEQDVIQFALAHGVALVAAAGNEGGTETNYPAAYRGVLAVTSTDASDRLASFSNRGPGIDLAAPGVNIFSTVHNNRYGQLMFGTNGTSFSTPFVSGAVALALTRNPGWTGQQAKEQVRISADNIDNINVSNAGEIGRGRLNMKRALTLSSPAVRITGLVLEDENHDGVIQPGEQVNALITLKNYLADATNLRLNLTSPDQGVIIGQQSRTIAFLGTLEETQEPLTFPLSIANNVPLHHEINFVLDFNSEDYQDREQFTIRVLSSNETVGVNNIRTTLTNIGRLGFSDSGPFQDGFGFSFKDGRNQLFEGALICGNGPGRISNAARANFEGIHLAFDADFRAFGQTGIEVRTPGIVTSQETMAIFNDRAASAPLGVQIKQESFAMQAKPNDDFVILSYEIENQADSTLSDFYFGLFLDWDLAIRSDDELLNSAGFDSTNQMGFVWLDSLHIGVSLLEQQSLSFTALTNHDSSDIRIDDGFSDEEKWQTISGGVQKRFILNQDVAFVLASGPLQIAPDGKTQVSFALLGGESLEDLQLNAGIAADLWRAIQTTSVDEPARLSPDAFRVEQNYPNPFNPETQIAYTLNEPGFIELAVYNTLGQHIKTLVQKNQNVGRYRVTWDGTNSSGRAVASGLYLYRLKNPRLTVSRKMLLLR